MNQKKEIKIGILTVSDRASSGKYEDVSGKTIINLLTSYIKDSWKPISRIVTDDQNLIEQCLMDLCDEDCCVIFTTGGTGPSKRDVTPEATKEVCVKILPGFGELMRLVSAQKIPTAILSRQIAGIRENSLIVNLPGRPSGVSECLQAIFPAIPDCLEVINSVKLKCNENIIKIHHVNHKAEGEE